MNSPNKTYCVATAPDRFARVWSNERLTWAELAKRCSEVRRTAETVAEYAAMSKDRQSSAKDVGGFVGGYLDGGVRKRTAVRLRSLITLDIDFGAPDTWQRFARAFSFAAVLYSTHSHTPSRPRFRLVAPLSREVTPAEYEPLCRKIAEKIGIDLFDRTTYDPCRLFYWPSAPKDGVFVCHEQQGAPCDPDSILSEYVNPLDASSWPLGSDEARTIRRGAERAGDPREKKGLIGAFCRAYSIEEAIDTFLTEVYEHTASESRYTYRRGHVSGGLICYDGLFAFSHHDTDPASGLLCNAFDLVRIHRFGELDKDSGSDGDVTALPSYSKMLDFASADARVKTLMAKERQAEAEADFGTIKAPGKADDEGDDWQVRLLTDRKGNIRPCPSNLKLIMLNDRHFRAVRYDTFSQHDTISDPDSPFVGTHAPDDIDDSSLSRMCAYLSGAYGIEMPINSFVDKALKLTAPERSYHAVRDFITAVEWDGTPRVDTLLIDYLGAEDTPLNRAITRKWMAGAVGRAIDIDPHTGEGIKFDYCLVLCGEQGTGKSTFAETLAGRWRGSISMDEGKKEQYETLLRSWIVEIPEFKGMRNADMDAIKDLITSRSDNFRAAYARQWNKNPRHSVLIGSTNNEYFLKDTTGNRRFWVVRVSGGPGPRSWAAKLKKQVPQIWAEALTIYKNGEPLMLSPEMEQQMRENTEQYNEIMGDPLMDYLGSWLEIPLPVDWETYEPARRTAYYRNYDPLQAPGGVERRRVTIHEIITCCPWPGISRYSAQRIGAILRTLGWEKKGRLRMDTESGHRGGHRGGKVRTCIYEKLQIESDDNL